ncbi:hypothetical protein GDO81_024223 [Engystomops pustulosus]|uniref:Uncharacterized protein n=1 Tax=Engystomops pustulosus TaxID=76066 RepID=A0AAV6YRJ4_ENGPU|nr:hypothetical protein GDO81_024223 [Engystomops pustulosus]
MCGVLLQDGGSGYFLVIDLFAHTDNFIQKTKQRYNNPRSLTTRVNLADMQTEIRLRPPYHISLQELGLENGINHRRDPPYKGIGEGVPDELYRGRGHETTVQPPLLVAALCRTSPHDCRVSCLSLQPPTRGWSPSPCPGSSRVCSASCAPDSTSSGDSTPWRVSCRAMKMSAVSLPSS